MRKQSAKYRLPCVTHRSIHVASEQCSWFTSEQGRSRVGRSSFFFGHGGNLFLLTMEEEVLCVFTNVSCWRNAILLHFLTHLSFTLLSSKAVIFFQHDVHPTLSLLGQRLWGLWELSEHFLPCLFFLVLIQISLLVRMGWQHTSQEECEKESCG